LLQTSSPNSPLWWAGDWHPGRISTRVTATPARATCQAASAPARPAPITKTFKRSTASSLDHQLQLTQGGTADVEACPAQGQQDRESYQDKPEIHGAGD